MATTGEARIEEFARQIGQEIVAEHNAAIDGPPCDPTDHDPYSIETNNLYTVCRKCERLLKRSTSSSPWVIYGIRERMKVVVG